MSEQQLNLIKDGVGRGGKRAGAGRKAKRFYGGDGAASSKTMRVPVLYADAVKKLIAALDAATEAADVQKTNVELQRSTLLDTDLATATASAARADWA